MPCRAGGTGAKRSRCSLRQAAWGCHLGQWGDGRIKVQEQRRWRCGMEGVLAPDGGIPSKCMVAAGRKPPGRSGATGQMRGAAGSIQREDGEGCVVVGATLLLAWMPVTNAA
jgi:hypothetical protein